LQPVQFVSMTEAPGATEKTELEEFALTNPLLQPTVRSSAGAKSSARFLENGRTVTIPTFILSAAPAKNEPHRR
jgi:hypothetical protein